MYRRRRRTREIPFSFDSFLDIVANVVGIIIRLILVVWVGARSYGSIQALSKPETPSVGKPPEIDSPADPLLDELARDQRELAAAQARLLAQLRQIGEGRQRREVLTQQLTALTGRRQQLEQAELAGGAGIAHGTPQATSSLMELRQHRQRLEEELRALEKSAPATKKLCYRAPISRPVEADELHFECRGGHITFLDLPAMIEEVRHSLQEKGKLLRDRWSLTDTTRPYGPFRLRYTIERQRDTLDAVVAGASPNPQADYACTVSEAAVEPMVAPRGETAEAALAPGSEFRRITDAIDPQFATVTFWVYPDSFALFRQLRDHLYDRNVTVAGRPLPDDVPIRCSSRGSISRGQ